jgi:peptidoglycan/LPS O-acetylase OafA/YrhL
MISSAPFRELMSRRFEPPVPPLPSSGKNASIQGLRACAALFVILLHLTPDFPYLGQWLSNMAAGPGSVMLFFVISGYVIGLTTRRARNDDSRLAYWRRRLIRIGPLYLVGLAFTAIIAAYLQKPLPLKDLIAHLFFLQNNDTYGPFFFAPAWNCGAFWSLNYEMVFYALFLLVWRYRPTVGTAFGLTFACSLFTAFLPAVFHVVCGYSSGFLFWLAGLWLAWCRRPTPAPSPGQAHAFPAAGLILMLIALHASAPEHTLRTLMGIPWEAVSFVSPFNLVYLPVSFLLVGGATGCLPPIGNLARLVCLLPPAVTVTGALLHNSHLLEPRWGVAAFATMVGGALLWTNVGSNSLPRLAWIGAISYALYIFHTPIHYLVLYWLTLSPYAIAAIATALCFGLAWLLETYLPSLRPASRTARNHTSHSS